MLKRVTIILCLVLFIWEYPAQAQSFVTGKMGMEMTNAGRIRIYAPDLSTQQINRLSLLVGTAAATVFDYNEDADSVFAAGTVALPQWSDYEIYASIDNRYSGAPPAIRADINILGWTNQGFAIAKVKVINQETAAVDAIVGWEFIARLDGTYSFESVEYLPSSHIVNVFDTTKSTQVGLKILSSNIASLKTFEWYEDYDNDTDFYTWMTYGAFDTLYESGSDGAVGVFAQPSVNLGSGAATTVYVGIAVGADEAAVVSNMDSAEVYYNKLLTGLPSEGKPVALSYRLDQNYPNPFNPQTSIQFYLPRNEQASLKVYDLLGREVRTLFNQAMPAGEHNVTLDAADMTSGIYFYTLQTNTLSQTRKMIVIR